MRRALIGLMACGAAACGSPEGEAVAFEHLDQPVLSFEGPDGVASIQTLVDGRLVMSGLVPICFSACATERTVRCALVADGPTLRVQGAVTTIESAAASSCTTECVAVSAECRSGPLAIGEYTLAHGVDRVLVTVGAEPRALPDVDFTPVR